MSEREILFRGKRVDNGEWIEGEFVPSLKKNRRIPKEKKGGKAMSASTDERAVELMAQADPDCCCCKYHKGGFCGKFNDEAAADFECVMWGFAHWEGDLDFFRILAEYGDEEDSE